MKPFYKELTVETRESPPMRGRGLKLLGFGERERQLPVAPHAGARIETSSARRRPSPSRVAPHAGARIETHIQL